MKHWESDFRFRFHDNQQVRVYPVCDPSNNDIYPRIGHFLQYTIDFAPNNSVGFANNTQPPPRTTAIDCVRTNACPSRRDLITAPVPNPLQISSCLSTSERPGLRNALIGRRPSGTSIALHDTPS